MNSFYVVSEVDENKRNFNMFLSKYSADNNLLYKNNGIYTINDFINKKEIEDGVCDVYFNDVRFSFFYKNNGKNKLYVFLSGGRTTDKNGIFIDKLPRFKRWSFYSHLDGDVLVVEDPMYFKFEKLRIGWFYGEKEVSYIELLCNLVKEVARKRNIEDKNIIFYSSSAGGYAAIHASSTINGSKCISINPQIILKNDVYIGKFESITGNNISKDGFLRNDTYTKINNSSSKIVIIQNIFDKECIKCHLIPFSKQLGINITYGYNEINNVIIYTYAANGGHIAYENTRMLPFILKLIAKCDINEDNLYHNFSMIWYDYYKEKK